MPSNYTGDPSAVADALPIIACPVDGDARNAASVNSPLQALADFCGKLWQDWQPTVGAAARVLLKTISNAETGRKTRFYVVADGTFEITFNCAWSEADSWWAADNATGVNSHLGNVTRLRLGLEPAGAAGVFVDRPFSASAVHWTDVAASWETHFIGGAGVGFLTTKTDTFGSNPPATTAVVNLLTAKAIPKAWGKVFADGGTATLEDGVNVSAVAFNSNTIRVTLATAMADASFAPVVSDCSNVAGGTPGAGLPMVHAVSAAGGAGGCAYFDVVFVKLDGTSALATITSGKWGFDFSLFGRQDS